jgi:hypothetical protein
MVRVWHHRPRATARLGRQPHRRRRHRPRRHHQVSVADAMTDSSPDVPTMGVKRTWGDVDKPSARTTADGPPSLPPPSLAPPRLPAPPQSAPPLPPAPSTPPEPSSQPPEPSSPPLRRTPPRDAPERERSPPSAPARGGGVRAGKLAPRQILLLSVVSLATPASAAAVFAPSTPATLVSLATLASTAVVSASTPALDTPPPSFLPLDGVGTVPPSAASAPTMSAFADVLTYPSYCHRATPAHAPPTAVSPGACGHVEPSSDRAPSHLLMVPPARGGHAVSRPSVTASTPAIAAALLPMVLADRLRRALVRSHFLHRRTHRRRRRLAATAIQAAARRSAATRALRFLFSECTAFNALTRLIPHNAPQIDP